MAQNSRNNDFQVFGQILGATKKSGKFEPGVILGAEYFLGGILGGHVTGVGFLAKNKRSFPIYDKCWVCRRFCELQV